MSNTQLQEDWRRLAEASLILSGKSPDKIDTVLRSRHFEAAKILSGAVQLVHPCLIVGVLMGWTRDWLRDGIAADEVGKIPPGGVVPLGMELWVQEAKKGLAEADVNGHEWTIAIREQWAWNMHNWFVLMRPLKDANARTAHLVLNHLRTLLGLPVYIVEYKRQREYLRQQRQYRRDVFVPWMQVQNKRFAFLLLCGGTTF